MSDRDSFIEEVSEELRRDRMLRLWKRWGPWVIAGVALAVAAAGVASWMESRERAEAREAGAALIAAGEAASPEARAEAFAEVAAAREGGPALVARLSRAAALAEAGARDEAVALLEEIESDGSAPELYRELAGFKAAMLRAPDLDPQARAEALSAYAQEGAPFRLLALERRAAARLEAGDLAGARADLETALADPMLSQALRQ
ncbi:MAG: tetratricopeptide repeat protein, partial [Pseudomonadota bacterium]